MPGSGWRRRTPPAGLRTIAPNGKEVSHRQLAEVIKGIQPRSCVQREEEEKEVCRWQAKSE